MPMQPPLLRDRADLLVVDVAPVLVHAEHAGVRDHHRPRRQLERVHEAAPVDMREIDDHAAALALAHDVAAEPGEPFGGIRAAALRRPADRVLREVQQAQVAHTAPRERFDRLERAFERLAAFDAAERRDPARRFRRAHVGAGARPHSCSGCFAIASSSASSCVTTARVQPRSGVGEVQKLKNWPATPPSRIRGRSTWPNTFAIVGSGRS